VHHILTVKLNGLHVWASSEDGNGYYLISNGRDIARQRPVAAYYEPPNERDQCRH
jgi:hypothetical protein